jgi:hypothetical protein
MLKRVRVNRASLYRARKCTLRAGHASSYRPFDFVMTIAPPSDHPFRIVEHREQHIIEVIYPAHPSMLDVTDYTLRLKRVIDAQKTDWFCLVDQRDLVVQLEGKLAEKVALLNDYAIRHGMLRSARVVASGVLGLATHRVMGSSSAQAVVRVFRNRDEALGWLHAPQTP